MQVIHPCNLYFSYVTYASHMGSLLLIRTAYAGVGWFRGVFILSFYPYGIASGGMVISGAILLWSNGIADGIRHCMRK